MTNLVIIVKMSREEPFEMLKILLKVKKQMAELEGKVDSM